MTVLQRMTSAGIAEDRARRWLAAGWACVDGQVVTDPDTPTGAGSAVVLREPREAA